LLLGCPTAFDCNVVIIVMVVIVVIVMVMVIVMVRVVVPECPTAFDCKKGRETYTCAFDCIMW
jgi:hypothetical protein